MIYHILGPRGTFTELALNSFMKDEQKIIYHHTIEETLKHVDENSLGLVPIENTMEGYVLSTIDHIYQNQLKIIEDIYLDIEFICVYQDIIHQDKTLYVQFAAKSQCSDFISKKGFKHIIYTESNTTSYEYFIKDPIHNVAIIPKHTKHAYHSEDILLPNIKNQTRFVIVSKNHQEKEKDQYKVFMVLTPKKDYPGLLYDILGYFKDAKINLSSIISRPMKQVIGIYHFYISCEVSKTEYQSILKLEHNISDAYNLTILGCY